MNGSRIFAVTATILVVATACNWGNTTEIKGGLFIFVSYVLGVAVGSIGFMETLPPCVEKQHATSKLQRKG